MQTSNYRHWSGKIVHGTETNDVIEYNGDIYARVLDDLSWLYMGHAPMPQTRWQWLTYDYHHGRLMRYPLLSVLAFCVREFIRDGRKYLREERQ